MGGEICYLCGKAILRTHVRSRDHVIPSTLIARAQPRAKGFDYGGVLPTHEDCNNRFGDESYVSKALALLSVLHGPQISGPLQHAERAHISILPLNAALLPQFTPRDLRFFKIYDARGSDVALISDPAFYVGKVKTNPVRDGLTVSLAVLAKSASALLLKRHLLAVPVAWRIYAHAYTGDLSALDFSKLLGEQRPFDTQLRVWVAELPHDNWQVVYAAHDTLIFFTFAFHDRRRLLRELRAAHKGADTLLFLGTSLNQLMTAGWQKIE